MNKMNSKSNVNFKFPFVNVSKMDLFDYRKLGKSLIVFQLGDRGSLYQTQLNQVYKMSARSSWMQTCNHNNIGSITIIHQPSTSKINYIMNLNVVCFIFLRLVTCKDWFWYCCQAQSMIMQPSTLISIGTCS